MFIDLYYLSPNPYGGWVTYTAHLMAALRAAGHRPELFKIRAKSERKSRDFGYGERYRNISQAEALGRIGRKKLIVAAAKNFSEQTAALLAADAHIVLHDPTELKNLPELDQSRTIVIRRAGLQHAPGAKFIRHPYHRMPLPAGMPPNMEKTVRAVATSRIDFDKHTDIILMANRSLSPERKVQIHGFENRLYTRFKICPNFPEWEQSKAAYPRDRDAAYKLLLNAEMMVDMSVIKGDGGGTQYTTLEAWDAGAVPIIHTQWLTGDQDDMQHGRNCLAVNGPEDLVRVLSSVGRDELEGLRQNGYKQLAMHHPAMIGAEYAERLDA